MPETLTWKDPACPLNVQYVPEVFESIRRLAVDGLLSLPRVGLGVGGFLLGNRHPESIVIVDFAPIDCSHSAGPSFTPTPDEIAQARVSAHEKAGTSLEILGYYCSRPRSPVQIAEKDHHLYRTLCPGAGQFALLLSPSAADVSTAALFYRKSNGYLAGGTELPLEALPLEAVPMATPPADIVPAPTLQAASLFGAPPEPAEFPGFAAIQPREKLSWRVVAPPALVVLILILMFTTREQWMPRPPLELRTAETDGHFSIEWNRDAVRGLDHGVLTITDGTAKKPLQLNSRELAAGVLPYARQTTQFTATLDAGSIHGSARFVPPPAAPPLDSAPPSHP